MKITIPHKVCLDVNHEYYINQQLIAHENELRFDGENRFGIYSFKNNGFKDFPYFIDLDDVRLEFQRRSEVLERVALYRVAAIQPVKKTPQFLAGVKKIQDKYPWLKKPKSKKAKKLTKKKKKVAHNDQD